MSNSNVPLLVSTIDNTQKPVRITPIITSICTIACCITVVSAANQTQIEYPQQPLSPEVHTVSTNFAEGRMYNSGNINLYLDGVNAMDVGLWRSYQKISEISSLPENWNGNGASKFSAKLLDSIRGIVEQLVRQPQIFPTARDSIQLEYENDIGDYLEFELFENGRLKKFFCGHDGKIVTEDISVEMINEVVNKFHGFKI